MGVRTCRFALDRLIRRNGYQIYSRPNTGPVIWKRSGVLFKEPDILCSLPTAVVSAAYESELRYLEEVSNGW